MICYPGSSHFANAGEMRQLYEAMFLLNERGTPCRLVRTGHDGAGIRRRLRPGATGAVRVAPRVRGSDAAAGTVAAADVLVQPGRDDAFNRYRLPSKLPEFLASGRPVVLPRTNVGLRVQPGGEALVLETGDAMEIAVLCERIFADTALSRRLSKGGGGLARRSYDPVVNAWGLVHFYRRLARA